MFSFTFCKRSFCLPVVEAAAFGKPSIVTNAGSLPELVNNGETGFIVNIGDASMLASKMYLVAVDDNLRRKMGVNAKERAQKFKISNVAKQTLNAYSSWSSIDRISFLAEVISSKQ